MDILIKNSIINTLKQEVKRRNVKHVAKYSPNCRSKSTSNESIVQENLITANFVMKAF